VKRFREVFVFFEYFRLVIFLCCPSITINFDDPVSLEKKIPGTGRPKSKDSINLDACVIDQTNFL